MEPYNYSSQLGLSGAVPNFADSMANGYKLGIGIQDHRLAQEAAALKLQQAQAAAEQQAEQQRQLKEFSDNPNPTAADYAKITRAFPQLSEGFKRSWDMLEPAQKDAHWQQTASVYAATLNNKPEVAAKLLNDHADALENSGDTAKAEPVRKMAQVVESQQEYAKKMAFLSMYAQDPKKATDLATELDRQTVAPAKLKEATASADKAVSDASTAATTAKYAGSKALADLEKSGWDIKSIQADIGFKRESNRISAMNAAANRESNGLKRQELLLKVDDARAARDQKINERVAQAESEITTVQDVSTLIKQIRSDPDTLKAATGASAWRGMIPGTATRTMSGRIEQLGNMLAATNLDKLKGPMSDKDIVFVKRISGNLDKWQSEKNFGSELERLEGIMTRTEERVRGKYGATGAAVAGAPAPSGGQAAPSQKAAPAAKQRNITVNF